MMMNSTIVAGMPAAGEACITIYCYVAQHVPEIPDQISTTTSLHKLRVGSNHCIKQLETLSHLSE